jgi:hypothetical protein
MILYSTCRDCGGLMHVTDDNDGVHPTCTPRPAPPTPSLQLAALWYAGLGWPVFPLLAFGEVNPRTGEVSDGKKPATRHGFKDASIEGTMVYEWWDTHPNANIGIATGVRFDVIDIDVPDGLPTLQRLTEHDRAVHGWVSTASGGVHLYITPTGNPNKARWLPGTDYRGAGGYVVAPPSVTDDSGWTWKHPPSPLITGRGDTYGVFDGA